MRGPAEQSKADDFAAAAAAMLDAVPVAALLLDPGTQRALLGNAEAAALLACQAEDLPAVWDQLTAKSSALQRRLAKVTATTVPEVFDSLLARPGQPPRGVLVRARRIAFGGREVLSVALVDITRRRWAEAALSTANRRLEVALAGADLGAWHWDARTRLLHVSPRWAAMLGRPPPAGGIPLKAWESLLHPDDLPPTRRLIEPLVRGMRDRYEAEFRMRHAAGHWVWVRARGQALERDAAGRPLVITGTQLDLTEARQAAAAQEASERQSRQRLAELELLYRTAPLGLAQLDRDLRCVRVNDALAAMNGYPIEAHLGRTIWELVPDLQAVAEPMLRRVLEQGEAASDIEFSGETARFPGMKRDWLEQFYPVRDPETQNVLGVGIVCEDITERRQAERARELLLRELDHRVKNLFAIIGGLVSFTARAAPTPDAMRRALLGRIEALAQAHDLVRPALGGRLALEAGGTELELLVVTLLRPFGAAPGDADRLVLVGPAVRLGPTAAPPLALALHELATNAAKYGALAAAGGQVQISWSVIEPAAPVLRLNWREAGGPPVVAPERGGFGHRLVTQSAAQLGGTARFDWDAAGLVVELRLPLSRLVA